MNRSVLVVSTCFVLGACASIPDDRGKNVSESLIVARSPATNEVPIAPSDVDAQKLHAQLAASSLTVESAVQIALLNNPRMRILYAELGFAQADLYDASRLTNPSLGFLQLSADGNVVKTTWSLSQRFTELLFLKVNTSVARSQLLQTQQRVASEVLKLEAEVRRAYFHYVSAHLVAQTDARMADTARVSADYAQQLYDAGNISQLQLGREQVDASDALIRHHKAAQQESHARGELFNMLGLPMSASTLKVDERLPLPVKTDFEVTSLQAIALQQRLDIDATREASKAVQLRLAHVKRWRWLGKGEVGVEREKNINEKAALGPAANLEIPLFNQGGGELMRARAQAEVIAAQLANMELTTRNNIEVQLKTLSSTQEMVEHYRLSYVPLRQLMIQLTQQQHNYMLLGTPDLLDAKQKSLDTYQAYIEAVRDYWFAYIELASTVGGRLPDSANASDKFIVVDGSDVVGEQP